MTLHACVPSVSLVIQVRGGNVIGSATAFFYKRGEKLFLVTNNHVCRNDKDGVIPDLLRLKLHTNPNDLTKNADYDIPLYAGGNRLWKAPPSNPTADVALLELNGLTLWKSFTITHWEANSMLPQQYPLHPGEDVFIMGYPYGFHDDAHNLPVFRNAMIASSFRVPFQGLPLFLTDGNLHPGMSGSPVISKPKNVWVDDQGNANLLTGTMYYLLGVHSGTYSVLQNQTGQPPVQIPLGLGMAWYANLVEETAASF